MRKPTRRDLGEIDRRGRILAAAEELFARKGFDGSSIRGIARKAKTNTALIYYYFGDKEGLFRATLEKAVVEVPQILEKAISSSDTVEDGLHRILQMIVTLAPKRSHFFQILHRELAMESPRLSFLVNKYFHRNYELVKSLMEKALSDGKFRELDLELAPLSLLAMILFFFHNSFLVRRVLKLDPFDEKFIRRLVLHTLDLFLHGALAEGCPGERKGHPSGKRHSPEGSRGAG